MKNKLIKNIIYKYNKKNLNNLNFYFSQKMKLTKIKNQNEQQALQSHHIKNASSDFSNTQDHPNFFLSKLISQNPKIKNELLIRDSLPNIKISIQNIFANDEKKEKAFQYLIKKSKDKSVNNSTDVKNALSNSVKNEVKNFNPKKVISPYMDKKFKAKPIIAPYNIRKSNVDIHPLKKENKEKQEDVKNNYRYSGSEKLISEDEPLDQNDIYKENNFWQNNSSIFSSLTNNMNKNKNKGNKYTHIPISKLHAGSLTNLNYTQRNRNIHEPNKTYDNMNNYSLRNNCSQKDINTSLNQNPYKDYLKVSNMKNIKKSILNKDIASIVINISNSEKIKKNEKNEKKEEKKYENNNKSINIQNNFYTNNTFYDKKNKYVKRLRNDNIDKEQNNDILSYIKKSPIKNNRLINSRINNNFYLYQNPGHKTLNQKRIIKENSNANSSVKYSNNNKIEYNFPREKGNNNYYYNNIYRLNDFSSNTLDSKSAYPKLMEKKYQYKKIYNGNNISQLSTGQINIDSYLKKDYCNSPFSMSKFNNSNYNSNVTYNKKDNNKKDNNNKYNNCYKKVYQKRNTFLSSPSEGKFMGNSNESVPNFNNYIKKEMNNININSNKNIINQKKFIFNDENEIIDYLRKKYNKRNVEEILDKVDNGMPMEDIEKEKNNPKKGLLTTEEGNKIRQKNEELSTEIKQLLHENKLYKKELNDIKNRFDDLSKEITHIKGSKY